MWKRTPADLRAIADHQAQRAPDPGDPRGAPAGPTGGRPSSWAVLSELGAPGLLVDAQAHGGLGLNPIWSWLGCWKRPGGQALPEPLAETAGLAALAAGRRGGPIGRARTGHCLVAVAGSRPGVGRTGVLATVGAEWTPPAPSPP